MKKSIVAAAVVAAAGLSGAAASEVFAAGNTEIVRPGDPNTIAETSNDPALGSTQKSREDNQADGTPAQDSQDKGEGLKAGDESPADKTEPGTLNKKEEDNSGMKEEEPGQVLENILPEGDKTPKPDTLFQTGNQTDLVETTVADSKPLKTPQNQITDWSEGKYYQDGKALTGIHNIEDKLYYFDQDGNLIKGQSTYTDQDGKEQYVCSDLNDGYLFTGFFDLGGKYETVNPGKVYYDPTSGFMHFGFLTLDSGTYYFDKADGRMVTGQKEIDREWYCFDLKSGAMKTGLTDLDSTYEHEGPKTVYYATADDAGRKLGSMVKGIYKVGNDTYYFSEMNGAVQKNVLAGKAINGKEEVFYFGKDGRAVKGQIDTGYNQWRFFDMETGYMAKSQFVDLKLADGSADDMDKRVYYGADGIMVKGQKEIGGHWFFFNRASGAMATGMTHLSASEEREGAKTVYYAKETDTEVNKSIPLGAMIKGLWRTEDGLYYFSPITGARAENQLISTKINDSMEYLYFGKDGVQVKGQAQTPDGGWRYFDLGSGIMLRNQFKKLDKVADNTDMDKWVYFDNDGVMAKGQKNINGSWYGFNRFNGAMFTGRTELDSTYEHEGPKVVLYQEEGTIESGLGRMLYGRIEVGDKVYFASRVNGALEDGHPDYDKDGTLLYFYDTYGEIKKNSQINYNGGWYFVGENGKFVTDKLQDLTKEQNDGVAKTVYYGQDGRMVYGLANVKGGWRYFQKATGAMQKNQFVDLQASQTPEKRARISYFDQNGVMKTASFTRNNAYIMVNSDGTVTGCRIDNVTYYSQLDGRWKYSLVGNWTMGSTGCNPTSLTMIVNALNNTNISPYDLALELHRNGYMNARGIGTYGDVHEYIPQRFNLSATPITSLDLLVKMLKMGAMVAAAMDPGIFVDEGYTHEIMFCGYENGRARAYDPYTTSNNGYYSVETLWRQRSTDPDNDFHGCAFVAYMKM